MAKDFFNPMNMNNPEFFADMVDSECNSEIAVMDFKFRDRDFNESEEGKKKMRSYSTSDDGSEDGDILLKNPLRRINVQSKPLV
jgi:hypothetical protein